MTTNNPTAPASPPPEGRAYTDEQLIYAATSRCPCGAALAYVPGDPRGAWDCSAILTGRAIPAGQPGSVQHTDRLSFVLWEVKSERQPTEGRDLATQFVSTGGEETIAADLRAMEEASFHILNEKARMLYAEAPANAGDFDPEAIEDLLAHCEVRSARTMEPRKSEWKRRAAAVRALAAQAREVEGLRSRVAEIGEQLNLAAAQNYCTMCGVTPEDEASREATTPTPEPARDGGGAVAPSCTVCGAVATRQDIDGDWWPPCGHAKEHGVNVLRTTPAPAGGDVAAAVDLLAPGNNGRPWNLTDALAKAMQHAWDDFTGDTGCFPDCIKVERGKNVELSAAFDVGNFALFVAGWLLPALQADRARVLAAHEAAVRAVEERAEKAEREAKAEARARREQEHRTMGAVSDRDRLLVAIAKEHGGAGGILRSAALYGTAPNLVREDGERMVREIAAALATERARAEALGADAERFQWLAAQSWWAPGRWAPPAGPEPSTDLRAAIDEARAAESAGADHG